MKSRSDVVSRMLGPKPASWSTPGPFLVHSIRPVEALHAGGGGSWTIWTRKYRYVKREKWAHPRVRTSLLVYLLSLVHLVQKSGSRRFSPARRRMAWTSRWTKGGSEPPDVGQSPRRTENARPAAVARHGHQDTQTSYRNPAPLGGDCKTKEDLVVVHLDTLEHKLTPRWTFPTRTTRLSPFWEPQPVLATGSVRHTRSVTLSLSSPTCGSLTSARRGGPPACRRTVRTASVEMVGECVVRP